MSSSSPAPPPPVRWGVLGVSAFAMNKLLPAMRLSESCELAAIASRDLERASDAASILGIPKSYGDYESLLADPSIEAVYIPLPNHLHAEWTIKSLEAGKHVLCEKPLALNAAEVRRIIDAQRRTGRIAAEAFMVRTHPQWRRAAEIASSGRLGDLRLVQTSFSYNNTDPANVRNVAAYGGGALLDIGCYAVFAARLLFGEAPLRVAATIERDPAFHTDRLVSALIEFPSGQAHLHVSTQLVPYQRVIAFGTAARLEIEIPFNAPRDRACRLWLDDGSGLQGEWRVEESFEICDQYTVQGAHFARAVRGLEPPAVTLEDSLINAATLDALVISGSSGRWEQVNY